MQPIGEELVPNELSPLHAKAVVAVFKCVAQFLLQQT